MNLNISTKSFKWTCTPEFKTLIKNLLVWNIFNLHKQKRRTASLVSYSLLIFPCPPPNEQKRWIKYQLEHVLNVKKSLYFSISLSEYVGRVLAYVICCFCMLHVVGLGGKVMRKEKYLLQRRPLKAQQTNSKNITNGTQELARNTSSMWL